jgi:RHS repeat-associated protein
VVARRLCEGFAALLLCLVAGRSPKVGPQGGVSEFVHASLICDSTSTPSVGVTPPAGSASWMSNTTGHTATFTVQNTGDCSDNYNFTASVSGPISVVSLDKTTAGLPRGGSTPVTVTYNVGTPGTGTLTLTAASYITGASAENSYSVTVLHPATVTPHLATAATRAPYTPGYSETFTVQNNQAISDTITLTCIGATNVACTGITPAGLRLGSGASAQVTASYYTLAAGTGTLRLIALASIQSGDTGTYSVPVVTPTVLVTPDAAGVTALPNGTAAQRFAVQNLTAAQVTYNLAVVCTGTATGCSAPTSTAVAAGATGTVTVSYGVGSTGTTGTVKLTATNASQGTQKDSGWVNVTAGGSVQTPVVDVASVNPGSLVERSACLTLAAGAAAAAECGDLRIVHPLPTTRTRGKARTPTLLYNSQFAHPYPLVAANVTLATGAATPDSVVAVLHDSATNAILGRGSWAGSDWVPGTVRRVVVGYDALSQASGIYSYKLELFNWYGASAPNTVGYGQFVVVNRSGSHFGAGWWLAGLEQLDIGTKVWYGGDGSVRRYLPAGTNTWAAPSFDRPDTLKWDGTSYVRYVTHGLRVRFDATGKHIATVNRLGDSTVFTYNGDTLKTITLPPAGSGLTYQFAYSGGYLLTVTPPPAGQTPRTITLTASSGQVAAIRGPDTTHVGFSYDPGFANRIVTRTDRRAFATNYVYDAAGRVRRDSLYMGTGPTPIVLQIRPLESLGFGTAVDTAQAYARLDGPRVDVLDTTAFWLDRFGQPRRIVNALGFETVLTRGNGTYPALVTKVRYPNARVVTALYDARGNITSSTDSSVAPQNGKYATTRFVWNTKWDFDSIIAPPEADSVVMSYDASNGNRVWQQDARGSATRVTFSYNASGPASGLLSALQTASGSLYSFRYDALGNVDSTGTPMGFWTASIKDGVGRDTLVESPIDVAQTLRIQQRTSYDVMDRDTLVTTSAPSYTVPAGPGGIPPSVGLPAQTSTVRKHYDLEGHLDTLARRADPDSNHVGWIKTAWHYDPAYHRTAEVAPDGYVDSTTFDAAGNATAIITRRQDTIAMSYDALNRLTSRIVPAVFYGDTATCDPGYPGQCPSRYPLYHFDPSIRGLKIPPDTAKFTYDSVGNVRTANNRAAHVTRYYNRNGTIAVDTLRIAAYGQFATPGDFNCQPGDLNCHVYGLRFGYDLDGRRVWLKHPAMLAPSVQGVRYDSVAYAYDLSGHLATVRDVMGNTFQYFYDADSRLDSLAMPGGVGDKRSYDPDSRLSHRLEMGLDQSVQTINDDSPTYDARAKVLHVSMFGGYTLDSWYAPLGPLVRAGKNFGDFTYEDFLADALDNTYFTETTPKPLGAGTYPQYFDFYQAGVGRQTLIIGKAGTDYANDTSYSRYDRSGNRYWQENYRQSSGNSVDITYSYFAADQTLAVAERITLGGLHTSDAGAWEEYRYDALGRRVLLRARRDSTAANCGANNGLCTPVQRNSYIERTVWDGDQPLYEIRAPGGDRATAGQLEADTVYVDTIGAPYGRVAYTYGTDLDQPLDVIRVGYSFGYGHLPGYPGPVVVVPHFNWLGHGEMGTLPDGTDASGLHQTVGDTTAFVEIVWPALTTDVGLHRSFGQPVPWFGNAIDERRDLSQNLYMRNRYYDPVTGRFTQEDPIGLAGGLNLYGFAGGDPVNFSDPFGLCPPKTLAEVFLCTGQILQPWQPVLETWATAELSILPLGGGGGRAITKLGLAEAGTEAYAAGRALTAAAAAKGRETILQQGSRILTASRHALTGSAASQAAHDFAAAGLDVGDVAAAVGKDIGDLSKLAPGFGRGAVDVGGQLIRYTRQTLESGETVVNFWMAK